MISDSQLSTAFREQFDLSQKKAAGILGVTIMTISRWERQVFAMPFMTRVGLLRFRELSLDQIQEIVMRGKKSIDR